MTIRIGNAPCSWGVEFADDARNPSWQTVLKECSEAGYNGIELGPVGFMPEDPSLLGDALAAHSLELIGGVVFRAFHDADQWDDVLDGAKRTCEALTAHGAKHFVLIDSISPRRQMDTAEWNAYRDRIVTVAKMGAEEYGLIPEIHPHAGGFFMQRHLDRITYVHFKDTSAAVKADVIANRTGFYDACGQGIFCNLGDGEVDFPAVHTLLTDAGFSGWCTIEQDCDPTLDPDPVGDARLNRNYLESIGFRG